MEIFHRIGINTTIDRIFFESIKQLGIHYESIALPGDGGLLVYFDIAESSPDWNSVNNLIKTLGASDVADTFFTDEEIMNSPWVRVIPLHVIGYPQPEDDWQRNHSNYDNYCTKCGVHQQKGEFRIKKEPKLGKYSFATLYWAYAFFCGKNELNSFAENKFNGYKLIDVLINSTSRPSEIIKQILYTDTTLPGLIEGEKLNPTACTACGITKYEPHMKGMIRIKKDSLKPQLDFIQTNEWFGSGHSAYREILISNRVARLMVKNKWKGIRLKAIETT